MPQRIQLKRTKGWRKPEGAVVVSRPSRWGNPFVVGGPIPDMPNIYGLVSGVPHATPQQAVEAFRIYAGLHWIPVKPEAHPFRGIYTHGLETLNAHAKRHLRGRDLACWCPPYSPCHADVLLKVANS